MAAEIAVSVALVLVETVIIFLRDKAVNRPRNSDDDFKRAELLLRRMKAFLEDSESQIEEGGQMIRNRVEEVQKSAHEIENALDMFMLQLRYHTHRKFLSRKMHELVDHLLPDRKACSELSSKIEGIEKRMSFVSTLDSYHRRNAELNHPSSSIHHHQVLEDDQIYGFDKHKDELFRQLTKGDSRLLRISITGPGGSGKTTLVKNVYDSKRVQGFFDCHAWIDVPRTLDLGNLLHNMLSNFDPQCLNHEPVLHEDLNGLPEKLRLCLQNKRYLVVLDNVWTIQDLNCIVNILPNNHGSRVIITTRKAEVAKSDSQLTHDLNGGLSHENAWCLFCKKAFQNSNGKCPPELVKWSEDILKKCDGLPLAISAVATLLSKKRQSPVEWKKLHDSLGSEIRPDSNLSIISRIFQPSYTDLPSHLKSCFLYFGIIPEDYPVGRERLIRMWVAEGFVMPRAGLTMEQVARDYLNELIERNLVHANSREIDGQVRSCSVLNLVREFIISKAENFMSCSETNINNSGQEIRHLSVHNISKLSGGRGLSYIRTLVVFGQASFHEKVLKPFKFLRVLDLQGVPLDNFPNNIVDLILLRYLSLRETRVKKVPETIKNLIFLETLDLKQTQVTSLPKEICQLHNLHHLLVYRYDVKNYVTFKNVQGVEVCGDNIAALSLIQKLSLIKVKNNKKFIKALGDLKDLRKLGVVDLAREDGKDLCCSVQKMENLSTFDVRSTRIEALLDLDHMPNPPRLLQRLYLKGRLETLPEWIPQLDSVTKIGLKWSKLNASVNPLVSLAALPNLMELELVDYYRGDMLEFKADTFKKLKILLIEQFDQLNMFVVEKGAMPMLKKLSISKCQSLKLLPVFGIEDPNSLQLEELFLYDMHREFVDKLETDCEERDVFQNVQVIQYLSLGNNQHFTGFKNLSPSQWHVRS